MSPGEPDEEIYTDVPTSAPVSDMRLKIAMFNTSSGTSATKPKLGPQPSRGPANGVGPKPPEKLPPKKNLQEKASTPMAPKSGKPALRPGPLLPKNRTNEGTGEGKGGGPAAVRQSVFHQANRGKTESATKADPSSATLTNHRQNDTLYPPDCKTPPSLPTSRAPGMNLIRVGGKTFRKLPFVVPGGPPKAKPPKPPAVLYANVAKMRSEKEEIYEDASSYREETQNAGEDDEDDYEKVDAFSQKATNCDDELYDDITETT